MAHEQGVAEEQTEAAEATIARLEQQLKRTPASRITERGVLHYNLGLAWSELPTGDRALNLSRAIAALRKAATAFDRRARPVEHGRSQNALGTVLRALGSHLEAAEAFELAVELIPLPSHRGEHGAALNNLGLAYADLGRTDQAMDRFRAALDALSDPTFLRQRISVMHNLAQAMAGTEDPARIREAIDLYEEALSITDPQEHPYQWALLKHSLGGALTAVQESERAAEAFQDSLRVFTRFRWPFQYALAKNNLGLSYAQIGDVASLRRAVVAYEECLRTLDPRLHRPQWERAHENLRSAESALEDAGESGSRPQHWARLAADEHGERLLALVRERVSDHVALPDPRRTDALREIDHAVLELPDEAAFRISIAWLQVLMELPHDQFVVGLSARMDVHAALDAEARHRADEILDRTIQEGLLAPQRIRVRDTLYDMGYERPEPDHTTTEPSVVSSDGGAPPEGDTLDEALRNNPKLPPGLTDA